MSHVDSCVRLEMDSNNSCAHMPKSTSSSTTAWSCHRASPLDGRCARGLLDCWPANRNADEPLHPRDPCAQRCADRRSRSAGSDVRWMYGTPVTTSLPIFLRPVRVRHCLTSTQVFVQRPCIEYTNFCSNSQPQEKQCSADLGQLIGVGKQRRQTTRMPEQDILIRREYTFTNKIDQPGECASSVNRIDQ